MKTNNEDLDVKEYDHYYVVEFNNIKRYYLNLDFKFDMAILRNLKALGSIDDCFFLILNKRETIYSIIDLGILIYNLDHVNRTKNEEWKCLQDLEKEYGISRLELQQRLLFKIYHPITKDLIAPNIKIDKSIYEEVWLNIDCEIRDAKTHQLCPMDWSMDYEYRICIDGVKIFIDVNFSLLENMFLDIQQFYPEHSQLEGITNPTDDQIKAVFLSDVKRIKQIFKPIILKLNQFPYKYPLDEIIVGNTDTNQENVIIYDRFNVEYKQSRKKKTNRNSMHQFLKHIK